MNEAVLIDIEAMKAKNLPKCNAGDVGVELKDDAGDDGRKIIDALNKYLSGFCKPISRGKGSILQSSWVCPCCSRPLGGAMGSFAYSLVHGEGACSCGWICRANHYPKDGNGEIFNGGLRLILAYHPDVVQNNDRE